MEKAAIIWLRVCMLSIPAIGLSVIFPAARSAAAQQTCYGYDELGQLVAVVDPQGHTAIYDYDPVGNMLDIRRNDATTPVAITFVTPPDAVAGSQVQILGIGFSPTASQNQVTINGVAATVVSSSSCEMTVSVPTGAPGGSGTIAVTTPTGSATTPVRVIPAPSVTSLSRKSALFNAVIPNMAVTGVNFAGATFSFQTPAITITAASIDPSGTSAHVGLNIGTQAGAFALVATTAFGSSTPAITSANRFTVVDPNSTADSDGDGSPDVIEAVFGSDPLDPASVPTILPVPEAHSQTVSVLNGTAPPVGGTALLEADSLTVAVVNGTSPPAQPMAVEVDSLSVSVRNGP